MKLHLARHGPDSAAPVLLLHGFTGSSAAWGEKLLARLAQRIPVLAVDLPGAGRSRLPRGPEALDLSRVLDALEGVLDECGVEHAHWLGYSMGGRIALAAALLRSERVDRLILESASPGLETEVERNRRRGTDAELARKIEARGIKWFVDHWMSLRLFRTQSVLPPEVLKTQRERRLANSPAALATLLRRLGTGSLPSFWPRLAQVGAPTLLLTGGLDRKYEALARQMVRGMPRALHRSIPGVGHTVHLEAPDRWLDAVCSFLAGAPRDTGSAVGG